MNEWEWQVLEEATPLESVVVGGTEVRKGDQVRLQPRQGGDIFDLALAGQIATIESIEQDYEGRPHLAVVVEDDPGKDLGVLRQPGHRFFFSVDEVEPLGNHAPPGVNAAKDILIAGIGNIFLGDDGFGVEVAQRLAQRKFAEGVRVRDFGIRGYDLAYALLEGYRLVILIDAAPRRSAPGTLYVIEPELGCQETRAMLDAHAMNPLAVIQLAQSMGQISSRILLVGCEPATLGGEEGQIGLSDAVAAAAEEAVQLVSNLVAREQMNER